MSRQTFVDLCLKGKVPLDEMDDFIDRWHDSPEGRDLHDYLGMTKEEYSLWLRVPDALPYIIKARREMKSLTNTVIDECQDLRPGARSGDQAKITRLREWLKANGELI